MRRKAGRLLTPLPQPPPAPIARTPFPYKLLEARIVQRLRAAGVRSCEDWRNQTPLQRNGIWGVSRSVVLELDAICTAALERGVE
jgi:hypothetical protein